MTLAAQATEKLLSYVVGRLGLEELRADGGRGPWLSLSDGGVHGINRGHLRCFRGGGLDKLVFVSIDDGDELQGAMLAAFTPPDCALPHFVVDVAPIARDYVLFMDLLPRVDLATNPEYVRHVYGPLSDTYEGFAKDARVSVAPVPRSLAPFVSPWMRGVRCHLNDPALLLELTAAYASHWLYLLQSKSEPPVRRGFPTPAERDRVVRGNMYSKQADPVWEVLEKELGVEITGRVIEEMRTQGIVGLEE